MGCINGKQLLKEEDLSYIARNTAMDKDSVEVNTNFIATLLLETISILQKQYQNFLKKHPDGQISRKSFHAMMKECYPGTDTEKLERHIFRMYDTNKVNSLYCFPKQIFKNYREKQDLFVNLLMFDFSFYPV